MTNPETSAGPLWARLTATFFGTGYLRPGPGTWGSAATVLLWWLVARYLVSGYFVSGNLVSADLAAGALPYICAGFALVAITIGIPAATLVARATGGKDPQSVVIDETAGQLIALIAAPLTWQSLLAAFILFRAFDIVKPPPIRFWNCPALWLRFPWATFSLQSIATRQNARATA